MCIATAPAMSLLTVAVNEAVAASAVPADKASAPTSTAGPVTASRNFFPIIKDLLRDRGRRQRLQSAARTQPVLRHLVTFGSTRTGVSSRGGQNRQNRPCTRQETPRARRPR